MLAGRCQRKLLTHHAASHPKPCLAACAAEWGYVSGCTTARTQAACHTSWLRCRCDIYSTYLRDQGFQRLYTLEGGVQRYLAQQGPSGWQGSLFVFDSRMCIGPGMPPSVLA